MNLVRYPLPPVRVVMNRSSVPQEAREIIFEIAFNGDASWQGTRTQFLDEGFSQLASNELIDILRHCGELGSALACRYLHIQGWDELPKDVQRFTNDAMERFEGGRPVVFDLPFERDIRAVDNVAFRDAEGRPLLNDDPRRQPARKEVLSAMKRCVYRLYALGSRNGAPLDIMDRAEVELRMVGAKNFGLNNEGSLRHETILASASDAFLALDTERGDELRRLVDSEASRMSEREVVDRAEEEIHHLNALVRLFTTVTEVGEAVRSRMQSNRRFHQSLSGYEGNVVRPERAAVHKQTRRALTREKDGGRPTGMDLVRIAYVDCCMNALVCNYQLLSWRPLWLAAQTIGRIVRGNTTYQVDNISLSLGLLGFTDACRMRGNDSSADLLESRVRLAQLWLHARLQHHAVDWHHLEQTARAHIENEHPVIADMSGERSPRAFV